MNFVLLGLEELLLAIFILAFVHLCKDEPSEKS